MSISIEELHERQKRHRIAIYTIVGFCVVLAFSLFVLITTQNTSNRQAYTYNAKADGAIYNNISSTSAAPSKITLGAGVTINQALKNPSMACSYLQKYSKFSWLTLSWQRIQPANKNQWVWNQFDNWVNNYINCGQEVAVHIMSDATWAVQPFPLGIKEAGNHDMPPKNQQDYYNFVYGVAKHYKGKITRYSIENEAHWPGNWGATVEDYVTTLQTAYKAIHAADPQAIVEDHAMSYEGFGYLTTNWLISQDNNQQALDFANSYASHMHIPPPHYDNIDQVKQVLANPGVQRSIDWYNKILAAHQYYDHLQVHIGTIWQDSQPVFDFIHSNLKAYNDDKPIDIWEGWYGWKGAPGNGFDPKVMANDLTKQLITAFANKTVVWNYWLLNDLGLTDGEGHVGLVNDQGNPRLAATTYQIIAQKLDGGTFEKKVDIKNLTGTGSNSNVYVYKFTNNGNPIFVGWSINGPQTVSLPDIVSRQSVTITDISGNTTTVNSNTLTLTDSPIFAE